MQPTRVLTYHETPFRASNFVDPRAGSNPWLPLKPGRQWVREGSTLIGEPHGAGSEDRHRDGRDPGDRRARRRCWCIDRSMGAGQVVQRSLDYFAQDEDGNIWLMGGATEQYEAGRFVEVEEAWLAGVDGAKTGILMPADPDRRGSPPWVIARPPEEDGDAAEVERMQAEQCVPFDCFQNVLVVREGKRSNLDNELKYFAYGVGQIRNEPRSASRHEDIELLINVITLTPRGLAEASAEALQIDRRAAEEHARGLRSGEGDEGSLMPAAAPVSPSKADPLLRMQAVSKAYHNASETTLVFEDLDLDLHRGEITCARRSIRLWQINHHLAGRRTDHARFRARGVRWSRCRRAVGHRAGPSARDEDRHRPAVREPAAVPDRCGEHRRSRSGSPEPPRLRRR